MLSELTEGQMLVVFIKGSPHEPWMLGTLKGAGPTAATAADVAAAKELHFTIKEGAAVLRLQKYEAFEVGSRRFVACKSVEVVVPTSALRRHRLAQQRR